MGGVGFPVLRRVNNFPGRDPNLWMYFTKAGYSEATLFCRAW